MIYLIVIFVTFLSQSEPPFKAKEDFEIKFDLVFKQRTSNDPKTVHLNETRSEHEKRISTTPLPYLSLQVKIIHVQPEEVKLKIIKDDFTSGQTKKVLSGTEFKLALGFTDDIKDRISGYRHVIQFLSADKKIVSIILIEFDEAGNYFVNGEKRGKV